MKVVELDKLKQDGFYKYSSDSDTFELYKLYDISDAPVIEAVTLGAYQQVCWERDVATQQLDSIGKLLGQSMDDVLDCLDRQTPKKPIGRNHECPRCHNVEFGYSMAKFCDQCGQAIDWTGVFNDN